METDPEALLSGSPDGGCRFCADFAYTGRHEPYLIDDLDLQLCLWRCSRCGALWRVTTHAVLETAPEVADSLLPGWRQKEAWLRGASIEEVIHQFGDGRIGGEALAIALLHHDIYVASEARGDEDPSLAYTSVSAAIADGLSSEKIAQTSVARLMAYSAGRSWVLDPSGPRRCVLPTEAINYLDVVARGTVTESERMRGERG